MPKKPLTSVDYKALLKDILALRDEAEAASSVAKIHSYWAIGKRIEKLRVSEEAGYHNSVIRDLAADSGLAIRTLHQSLKLSKDYKKPPADDGLSWTHYRALLQLPSAHLRNFYTQKTKESDWTSRQLEAAIKAGLHLGTTKRKTILTRPTDPDFLYQVRVLDVLDGDTLDLDIDLGFGVARKLRVRFAIVNCPPLSTKAGRAARDFVAAQLMTAGTVAITTEKTDIYGRYIAHVFFTPQKTSVSTCFLRGDYLNDLLVQNKHAEVVG